MKRILFSLFWLGSGELLPAATVSLSSIAGTVVSGQQTTVQVNVAGVTDLYAWQLDVNFDPFHFTAVSMAEQQFLATGGATSFFAGTIDNVSGTITFNANSLFGAVPGVTGSGTIMSIVLMAGAPGGSSVLTLSNVTLLDSGFNEIASSLSGLSLEVTPSTVVPEPGTLALAVGAFVFVALGNRRTAMVSITAPAWHRPGGTAPAWEQRLPGTAPARHRPGQRTAPAREQRLPGTGRGAAVTAVEGSPNAQAGALRPRGRP